MHHGQREGLLKPSLLDPTRRVSDPVVLGWGLGICVSIEVPADSAGLETALFDHLCYKAFSGLGKEFEFYWRH